MTTIIFLNSVKTEILLIGPTNIRQNLLVYSLHLDGCAVISSAVKNVGVMLDSRTFHITKTTFFHFINTAKLQNMLPVSDAEKLCIHDL